MSDDLVGCLRVGFDDNEMAEANEICWKAADEIERLRSQVQDRSAWVTLEQYTREVEENEKLRSQLGKARDALGKIAMKHARFDGDAWFLRDIARAALADDK